MDTNVGRETITSADGYYTVPLLDPGRYQVGVQTKGFQPIVKSGITVQVDQVARVDFRLEIGTSTQTVLVEASAPILDAATSSLGQVVENRQITELPMNGRSTLGFVELTPGVRMQGSAGANPNIIAINGRGNFSANGGVSNANEMLVDGAPVTLGRSNAIGFIPPVDATEEFKVETSSYSAEYGRSSGAIMNVNIKSGTNKLHGSFYDFLRNSDLDSNNFFQNLAGQPIPKLAYNQYGVSVGGPIRHDRTFFFANFEGFNQRQAASLTTTVPTALQRGGDFSQTFTAAGALIPIADPAATVQNGSAYSRTPYPGNRIPASQLNPVAVNFTKLFWPLPNTAGVKFTNVNNFATSSTQPINSYQGVARVDHTLNAKWKLFATYANQNIDRGPLDLFGDRIAAVNSAYVEALTDVDAVLGATAVFSPHWLGEFRSSFIRFGHDRVPNNAPFDPTSIGLPASLGKLELYRTVPQIGVSGVTAVAGAATSVIIGRSNNWSESASLTWLQGRHTVKFGGNYRPMQANDVGGSFSPVLNFTGQFTSTNPQVATGGVGMATFLLGYPIAGSMTYATPLAESRWYLSTFVQDDWKVTRRLTLNLGLAYSLDSSVTERYNRVSWFDPGAAPPIAQTVGLPLVGAYGFGSSSRRTPENLYRKQWGPRAGFAFQLAKNTVVRGGYGLFWLPNNLQTAATSVRSTPWSAATTFVGSLDGGITPHDTLSNPFPNGIILPPGSSNGPNTLIGQALQVYLRSNHTGNLQTWNFDIQHELWKDIVVDIAYAGSKGTGLPLDLQLNQLNPQYLSMGTALTQQVANPFFGLVSSGILSARTVAREQLLRPHPQFDNILATGANVGSSSYHSMQLKITKRLGASLIAAAYTLSKCIGDSESTTPAQEGVNEPGTGQLSNVYAHRQDRSLAEFDAPQRLVLSYTLDLPFGMGQRFLNHTPVLNRVIGGWQLSGLYTAQSGYPIFLTTSGNTNNTYVLSTRPNNNGTSARLSGDAHARLSQWFNTGVFSAPPPFSFGNTSHTPPDVRTHGVNNLDFGLFKNNRFGPDGRFNLQLRGELFNVLNRVQFYYPDLSYGTPQFGVISAQANSPRQIQLAMKLLF